MSDPTPTPEPRAADGAPEKPWYRSRILWLNAFTAGAGAAIATGCISVSVAGVLTTIVAVVNVVLRYDTDHAIQ